MTEWITDRQPTEADGDPDGEVRVRRSPTSDDYKYLHRSHVGPGVPWKHSTQWGPPAPAVEPTTTLQPRRFVSISRTVMSETDHILDAIADDGTAWCLRLAHTSTWRLIDPLPLTREVPADA